MKKVLFVIPSISSVGGAEKLVSTLSTLLQHSFDISIATFDSPNSMPAFVCAAKYYPLGESRILPLPLRLISYIDACRRLSALKKKISPDVSISILWRADLINALTKLKQEKIASLAVINIIGNKTNSLLVKLRHVVKIVYRRFDLILAITPTILHEIRKLYNINRNNLTLFKTYVAPHLPSTSLPETTHRYVFCGRAVYEKNIEGLLHVFKLFMRSHPNRQLLIIGDGPLLDSLISMAKQLGLTVSTTPTSTANVLFVGSTDDPESFMLGAKAFLLPSRHEGLPTVLLLAASLGLPILASDCDGGGVRYLFSQISDNNLPLSMTTSSPLLPVPDSTQPSTIQDWVHAMHLIDTSETHRSQLIAVSAAISHVYSMPSVRADWIRIVNSICNP